MKSGLFERNLDCSAISRFKEAGPEPFEDAPTSVHSFFCEFFDVVRDGVGSVAAVVEWHA